MSVGVMEVASMNSSWRSNAPASSASKPRMIPAQTVMLRAWMASMASRMSISMLWFLFIARRLSFAGVSIPMKKRRNPAAWKRSSSSGSFATFSVTCV